MRAPWRRRSGNSPAEWAGRYKRWSARLFFFQPGASEVSLKVSGEGVRFLGTGQAALVGRTLGAVPVFRPRV